MLARLTGLVPKALSEPIVSLATSTQGLSFTLAFVASMGTFLGGLLVVLGVKLTGADPSSPSTKWLMGVLQSFSGGVMLFITCFDLIPEAGEIIGTQEAMLWMFAGIGVFGVLELVLLDDHDHDDDDDHHSHNHVQVDSSKDDQAFPTTAGSPVSSPTLRKRASSRGRKSASPERSSVSTKKSATAAIKPKPKSAISEREKKDLMRASFITFVALALHNLPEGLGVYLSAMSDLRLGTQLAVAIMLHNIPEGMAVAIPLYSATGSTFQVLWWTLVNGLAEPLGVIVGGTLLHAYLTPYLLSRCLALVGGIMLCISIHELQPTAIKYAGKVAASISFFVGMLVCFCALE
eukprot:jgi/Hompol1/2544/HPOL_001775-RA